MSTWDDLPPNAFELSVDDEGNAIGPAVWVPNDLRDRTLRAYDGRPPGDPLVDVFCPDCPRTIVGSVFATIDDGPIYAADIPSQAATQLAIQWSAPKEEVGRIPQGFSPVRVLLREPEPGERGRCAAACRKHPDLEVAIETLLDAVARGQRKVSAKHSVSR